MNIFGYPLFNRLFFPSWNWLPFMVLLVPAVAMLAIGATVIVSAKVKGFAEAQQISALIVLPILLLVFFADYGVVFPKPACMHDRRLDNPCGGLFTDCKGRTQLQPRKASEKLRLKFILYGNNGYFIYGFTRQGFYINI